MSTTINFCQTISGIPVSPQEANFQGDFTNEGSSGGGGGGSTASLRYVCAFANHVNLINALLSAYCTADYCVGMQHPDYAGLYANSVKVSTLPSDTDPQAFAVLDVSYKPLQFNPSTPGVVYEDSIAVSGEVVPLLKQSLVFADGTQVPNDADYLLTYLTYKRTLKNVSTVPLSAVIACLNKINSTPMTLHVGTANSYSIPKDQVLYTGIDEIKIQYTNSGSQRFDVTHCFLISPINLNYQYNPNHTPTSDPVWKWFELTTPPKYDEADMSTLGI